MSSKFDIRFFQTASGRVPVQEYLDTLATTNKDSYITVLTYIKMLAKQGSMLGFPYVRKMQGNVWELRPKSERVLYCCIEGNTIYLLHAFSKKSNKTPANELKTALQRYKQLIQG